VVERLSSMLEAQGSILSTAKKKKNSREKKKTLRSFTKFKYCIKMKIKNLKKSKLLT
jgi:hypothetical protein